MAATHMLLFIWHVDKLLQKWRLRIHMVQYQCNQWMQYITKKQRQTTKTLAANWTALHYSRPFSTYSTIFRALQCGKDLGRFCAFPRDFGHNARITPEKPVHCRAESLENGWLSWLMFKRGTTWDSKSNPPVQFHTEPSRISQEGKKKQRLL